MQTKKIIECPKCGSNDIGWHKGAKGDFRECHACGHVGKFNEKIVHDGGEELWPQFVYKPQPI